MLKASRTVVYRTLVFCSLLVAFVAALSMPCRVQAQSLSSAQLNAGYDPKVSQVMYRLYNRYTGEHFYTASSAERSSLVKSGWTAEGIGWIAPKVTKQNASQFNPVYRLYNPHTPGGDHHYTTSKTEYDALKKKGWKQEGIGWYSYKGSNGVALYRLYNPYAKGSTHHYTTNEAERSALVKAGWKSEGIAWRGYPSVLKKAYDQLGKPYEYGASGPDSFDCSGFVVYCYGSDRGRTTKSIASSLKATGDWTTDINKIKVGDLVFTTSSHVGIYVGNNYYIEASTTSNKVVVEYMYSFYGGGSYY